MTLDFGSIIAWWTTVLWKHPNTPHEFVILGLWSRVVHCSTFW